MKRTQSTKILEKSSGLLKNKVCQKLLKKPKKLNYVLENRASFVTRRYNYTKRTRILSEKVKNSKETEIEALLKRAENEPDNTLLNLLIGKFGVKKFVEMELEIKNKKKFEGEKSKERGISLKNLKKMGLDAIGIEQDEIPSFQKEIDYKDSKENLGRIKNLENKFKTGIIIKNGKKRYKSNQDEFKRYTTVNYFYKPFFEKVDSQTSFKKPKFKPKSIKDSLKFIRNGKNNLLRKKIKNLRGGFNSKLRDKLDIMLAGSNINNRSFEDNREENNSYNSHDITQRRNYEDNELDFKTNSKKKSGFGLREKIIEKFNKKRKRDIPPTRVIFRSKEEDNNEE